MSQTVLTAKSNTPQGVDQIINNLINSNANIVVQSISTATGFDFQNKELIYITTILYRIVVPTP